VQALPSLPPEQQQQQQQQQHIRLQWSGDEDARCLARSLLPSVTVVRCWPIQSDNLHDFKRQQQSNLAGIGDAMMSMRRPGKQTATKTA
jgi:hypothetical protein